MSRKSFTTTIEENIQKDFKEKCLKNNDKMNDVLETFMQSYVNGEFVLQTNFSLKQIKRGVKNG